MATQLTQADILALFRRILPASYIDPIIAGVESGYEMLRAWAKLWERASTAVKRNEDGLFILDAQGPAYALVTVQFYRDLAGAGAVTVKAGTILTTSVGDRRFVLMQDAVFGALDVGPISAPAMAVHTGWTWNVPGERTTLRGETLAGSIDTILLPVQDPPFGDPTILVKQVADATGGRSAMLDQLGSDRGMPRTAGEGDVDYRYRVRQLPDTISPAAFDRAVARTFGALGLTVVIIETWQIDYQTCWDGPAAPIGDYDSNLFCFDDPRANPPFRNRWLDEIDYRAALIAVVPYLAAMTDVGMAYDDVAMVPADFLTSLGSRAYTAYDVPTGFTAGAHGGYDGFDLTKQATYKALYDAFDNIRAGGVIVAIELEGE